MPETMSQALSRVIENCSHDTKPHDQRLRSIILIACAARSATFYCPSANRPAETDTGPASQDIMLRSLRCPDFPESWPSRYSWSCWAINRYCSPLSNYRTHERKRMGCLWTKAKRRCATAASRGGGRSAAMAAISTIISSDRLCTLPTDYCSPWVLKLRQYSR